MSLRENLLLRLKTRIKQTYVPILLSLGVGIVIGVIAFFFNHNAWLSAVITLGTGFISYAFYDSLTMVTELGNN